MNNNILLIAVVSMGGLGVFFGVVLALASKKFAVQVDERIAKTREILPGANCGACGFAGCDAFAEAVVNREAPLTGCTAGGPDVSNKIAQVLGIDCDTEQVRKYAKVLCSGDCQKSKDKYIYIGLQDCNAAVQLAGGSKSCQYGCLGLGSCVKACNFNAITIVNGIAVVDQNKCTGCGKCIDECPKGLIELVPETSRVQVYCKSEDRGKTVKQNCQVGCIGCRICVRECKFDAISFDDNLAHIDYEKCTNCMVCAEKCPTGAIHAEFAKRRVANIDEDKCIGCTLCKKECKFDAIEGEKKQPHKVLEDKCVGCGQCEVRCPKDAISMK